MTSNIKILPDDLKKYAITEFVRNCSDTNGEKYASITKYIKTNIAKLVDLAVEYPELLSFLCNKKFITAKNIELYIQKANESQKPEIISTLLDYQNSSITKKQKDAVEKRKEKQENEVIDRIVARSNKKGIKGLKFVISGDLETFNNRSELSDLIKRKGGTVASSISSKVDYLITNDSDFNSKKIKDAEALGIEIITERDFNDKIDREFVIEKGVLSKYCGAKTDVTIPDKVTRIGKLAFYDCTSLTNVTIPNSVIEIGEAAFYDCTSLANITIPDSVTKIDRGAFEKCTSLTNVSIPESVTSIGEDAFRECTNLKNITIPDSVTSIGKGAFRECASLTGIAIPQKLKTLRDYVFYECRNLTCITLLGGLKKIGDRAFSDCTSLTNITIPDSVTEIGDSAFSDCTSLTSITIPDSVTKIGYWTFSDCTSLTNIIIPDSVTEIDSSAFYGCTSLTVSGSAGSYAETYAKENNIQFVAE